MRYRDVARRDRSVGASRGSARLLAARAQGRDRKRRMEGTAREEILGGYVYGWREAADGPRARARAHRHGAPRSPPASGPELDMGQGWKPSHAVQLVAGTPPGGGLDRVARALAQALKDAHVLDVPIEVLNVPGDGARRAWTDVIDRHPGDAH